MLTAYDVAKGLTFVGDNEVRQCVLTALVYHVPAPVTWYVLGRAVFVGVGWSTAGSMWRCRLPRRSMAIPVCGASRNGPEVLGVVLHEVAHGFLCARPRQMQSAALTGYSYDSTLLRATTQPAVAARLSRTKRRQEQQADALAQRWGGTRTGSDEAALAYARMQSARLAERFGPRP